MINLEDCKSLNDIARILYGKANYTNREKSKKYLLENGIEWELWLEEQKEKHKRYCLNCGKELKRGQYKFCSQSCSATYNNLNRKNNNNISSKRYCKECGKELNAEQDNFCSTECCHNKQYEQYIEKWKNGEEDGLRGEYGISNHIRRYLLEKNNCNCQLCGWGERNQFTNKVPLEIHHIDGDYKNNKEENLQLLCPNCHSLTETFKSHNKNGRKGRNKY